MTTVTIEKAKEQLDQLIERARAGEEIVIRSGKGRDVKLVPGDVAVVPELPNRGFGILKGKIKVSDEALFGPLPDDELALWNGEGD